MSSVSPAVHSVRSLGIFGPDGLAQLLSGFSMGGFLNESAQDNIVAKASGTQANATQLVAQTSRVATVATAGDAILLPASVAGLELLVINHGTNAMQVFGAGTDTIDDVATATGVSQMPNSLVIYTCATAGKWYSEGLATGFGGAGFQTLSFVDSITANATQTQAAATQLSAMFNRVATSATLGNGVKLPASAAGLTIIVDNRGANPIQVYGLGADTINGIVATTGVRQGLNTITTYYCATAGNWETTSAGTQNASLLLLSADGAIDPHTSGTYVVTKGSAAALTLAAPTVTTDDGVEIVVTSNTAFAHVITATGLLQTGSASVNTATYAAQKGATLTLVAYQGKWNTVSQVGVAFA